MTRHPSETHQPASLYDVIQVSPSASQEVIQAAYRALARGYHPDVNPNAGQQMLQLNAAYDILGDTKRRAEYDLRRARVTRSVAAPYPMPSAQMRGKAPPNSPKRIEDERVARTPARPTWSPARSRPVVVFALIVILAVATTLVVWLASTFLDEVPDAGMIGAEAAAMSSPLAVGPLLVVRAVPDLSRPQPFLNHG